jgi:hypothetical protein
MAEELIKVGVANEGEINLPVSLLTEWKPSNVNQFGDTVFFKQGDMYYSMKLVDFKKLYIP